jgi:hypothetical protein
MKGALQVPPFLNPQAKRRGSQRGLGKSRNIKPAADAEMMPPKGGAGIDGTEGLPVPSGGVRLDNYTCQTQQETLWCWAAVASSVSMFYKPDSGMSQFDVAAAVINPSCRTTPDSTTCNSEQELQGALLKTGNLASDGAGGYHTDPTPGVPGDIETEIITHKRPLCCHIKWDGAVGTGESGHFVVISGYDPTTQEVCVEDSRHGTSTWLNYSDFVNNFDDLGHWDYTYWTTG